MKDEDDTGLRPPHSVGMGWTQIPLTPTLSPREREKQPQVLSHSSDAGFADRQTEILPLPSGEGRGEGNLTARQLCLTELVHPVSRSDPTNVSGARVPGPRTLMAA